MIAIARKKRKSEHNRTRITRGKDSYGVHDIKATKTLKRDASKHLCLSCFTKYRVPNFYTVKITNECSSSNNCRRQATNNFQGEMDTRANSAGAQIRTNDYQNLYAVALKSVQES